MSTAYDSLENNDTISSLASSSNDFQMLLMLLILELLSNMGTMLHDTSRVNFIVIFLAFVVINVEYSNCIIVHKECNIKSPNDLHVDNDALVMMLSLAEASQQLSIKQCRMHKIE